MKKCSGCLIVKEAEQFSKNSRKRDGLQTCCKECMKARAHRYYEIRADHHKLVVKEWRKKRLGELNGIIRAKKGNPCADCNRRYPYYVMDFDHVRGEKEFTISQISRLMVPIEVLLEEINKCEVVCSNCHRLRTAMRRESASN